MLRAAAGGDDLVRSGDIAFEGRYVGERDRQLFLREENAVDEVLQIVRNCRFMRSFLLLGRDLRGLTRAGQGGAHRATIYEGVFEGV